MSSIRRNVSLLAVCQAMLHANNSTLIAINALAGLALAPYTLLATLPVTCWVLGGALTTVPASLYMKRVGRPTGLIRGAAAFRGFAGNIHLDADLQRCEVSRALLGKPLGYFQAVHRVHPGKARGYQARLVALQRSDEVPFKPQAGQFRCLVDSFLHIVFAERPLSCRDGLAHAGGWPGLGNGQQLHGICRPPGGNAGSGDTCTHGLQVGGD